MLKDIRKVSRTFIKTNDVSSVVQWGVQDTRNHKIIRGASTREIARNFARRSKFLRVVKRDIILGSWSTGSDAGFYNIG